MSQTLSTLILAELSKIQPSNPDQQKLLADSIAKAVQLYLNSPQVTVAVVGSVGKITAR